jgi:hypothetical protein
VLERGRLKGLPSRKSRDVRELDQPFTRVKLLDLDHWSIWASSSYFRCFLEAKTDGSSINDLYMAFNAIHLQEVDDFRSNVSSVGFEKEVTTVQQLHLRIRTVPLEVFRPGRNGNDIVFPPDRKRRDLAFPEVALKLRSNLTLDR